MKTCAKHQVHFKEGEHCLSCGPEPERCKTHHTGTPGFPCEVCLEIIPPSRKVAPDPINPAHYGAGGNGIECIDAIAAAIGDEGAAAFCRGNAIKYLWRGGKKDAVEQDLRKAIWYIEREIKIRNTGTLP